MVKLYNFCLHCIQKEELRDYCIAEKRSTVAEKSFVNIYISSLTKKNNMCLKVWIRIANLYQEIKMKERQLVYKVL